MIRPVGRWMAGVVLAIVLFSAAAMGQAALSGELEAAVRTLRRARAGTWEADRIVEAVGALVAADRLAAAGWWIDEARDAVAARKLPGSTSTPLRKLESEIVKRALELHPSAVKLGTRLAEHAASTTGGKDYAVARRAVNLAALHLAVFPNPRAKRTVSRAQRKLARMKSETTSVKRAARDSLVTGKLAPEVATCLEPLRESVIADWEHFGTSRTYCHVAALVAMGNDPKADARIDRMRKSALEHGRTQELRLLVVGNFDIAVCIGGSEALNQKGAHSLQHQPGPLGWRVLSVRVLPGECVLLLGESDDSLAPGGFGGVSVHAELDGRPLPITHLVGTKATAAAGAFTAEASPIEFGKIVAGPSGPLGGISTRFAEFRPGPIRVPVYEAAETWMRENGGNFTVLRAMDMASNYILDIPMTD
jgi:hypothetical protein